jgi:hypothetical protein
LCTGRMSGFPRSSLQAATSYIVQCDGVKISIIES